MKPHILAILITGPALGVIASVLRTSVAVRIQRKLGEVEWTDTIGLMVRDGLITDNTTDEITGDTLIRLTPKGRKLADRIG